MSALTIIDWPAARPQWQQGLVALAVENTSAAAAGGGEGAARTAAREAVRAAICEAASLLLDIGEERLEVAATPGTRPRLLVDGADSGIGMSISHADTLSLAVLHRHGAVGVDLMRLVLPSDWARVAHDYLGMAQATRLAALAEDQRALAFCQAWTAREATLKLRGEQLAEWREDRSMTAPAGRLLTLTPAPGLVATVALD